jgi:uncharacterized membrane protein
MTFPNDPDMPKTPPRAPMRGWIKILLFTSLAVNVAVAGLAIGAVLRHGDMMGHRADRAGQFGGPYTSALSREDRRAIWQQMRRMDGEGRPDRASIRAEFAAVVAALRADPYDPDLVRDIVGRQFEAGLARQLAGQALLLGRIEAMSPAERAAFADRLSARLEAWRGGRDETGRLPRE